jgi:hypothetical protein
MKSLLFSNAIINRNRIRFLFGFSEIVLEPYYVHKSTNGKKVLYGKVIGSNEVKKFEYDKICNIRILTENKFSPVIPIIANYN